MPKLGYALSSEEHAPLELVRNAVRAEQAGFEFALISDHFHPWTDKQGESPFVWGVIGAIAQATERILLGTGVTCPTIRTHPAIVAHASATAAVMMEGRFFLGVGSGENLNEHILADRWPPTRDRLDMLEEAVEIIRELWTGKLVSHRGQHYQVANARLYTTPDAPPDVMVAAGGEAAAELAGRIGDGLVLASPSEDAAKKFGESGGEGKPRYGQCHVCWAESEDEAKKTALEWFPNIALGGEMTQELPQPAHFEQAAELLSEDDMAEVVACGPDPERHVEMIQKYLDVGCDHVYFHQIGPDQDGFFEFYESEVLPRFSTK
jgi:coenzyme F420-dependent glucose-6-phosphate dehydrogenase